MLYTPVDNGCAAHAAFYRIERTFHFRQHATVNRFIGNKVIYLLRA